MTQELIIKIPTGAKLDTTLLELTRVACLRILQVEALVVEATENVETLKHYTSGHNHVLSTNVGAAVARIGRIVDGVKDEEEEAVKCPTVKCSNPDCMNDVTGTPTDDPGVFHFQCENPDCRLGWTDIAIGCVEILESAAADINPDTFDFEKMDEFVAEGIGKLEELMRRNQPNSYDVLGPHAACLAQEAKQRFQAIQSMRKAAT